MIYFIQNGENLHIKIGYTDDDPEKRRSSMQVGNSSPLFLHFAMEGTQTMEGAVKNVFKADCVSGEWFRPTPKLVRFMLDAAALISKMHLLKLMGAPDNLVSVFSAHLTIELINGLGGQQFSTKQLPKEAGGPPKMSQEVAFHEWLKVASQQEWDPPDEVCGKNKGGKKRG